MINKLKPIRSYEVLNEEGETIGIIKTSFPFLRFHKLLDRDKKFKDLSELVTAIKDSGDWYVSTWEVRT